MLILDATNTVVLRGDAVRSFDRFEDTVELVRFADAASDQRSKELRGRRLVFTYSEAAARRVLELRESADRLFRAAVLTGAIQNAELPALLRAIASCIEGGHGPWSTASPTVSFEVALATSALSLLAGEEWRRVRICRNCNWLFVDRSRNASRLWCDMSVCGNRQKAKRHYHRRKAATGDVAYA
jgi:predicted RNA-binding Zn ribbon-like protein